MISWRVRRQLIALLIVIVPMATLVFWAVSKSLPEPTCFDGRKNQGELQTDCGGPCAPCELRDPRPISVFWARAVPVRPDTFDVAAFIQNQNEALSSVKVEYEFTLFDSFGEVARKSGSTFILSQERMYVVETNLKTVRAPVSVEFRIRNINWQFRKGERPNFVVEKHEYKVVEENGKEESLVESSIANRSPFDFREIEVAFVVLDRMGNVLGVNRVVAENFLGGSRRLVKSIWPQKLAGEVAVVEIEPRVNIFDPAIILKP